MKLAILCVAFVVAVCCGAFAEDETPRVWVVAVGVSKYVRSFQSLGYASDGAQKVSQAILSAKPQVTSITVFTSDSIDPSLLPTRNNVMRELKQLEQKVAKGDLVIFYFCGHGVEASGQQLLLMMDADLSDSETTSSSTIGLSWLREKLEALPCNGRLLWLDACRESAESLRLSGGPGSASPMTNDFLTTGGGWQTQPGRISATLFGCKDGEKVYHGRNGSFFSEALVAGLGGQAADADGQVTLNSLTQYVKKNVRHSVAEEMGPSAKQEPVLMPKVVSDVILRPAIGYIACLAFAGEQGELFAETVQTRLASSAAIHLVERMRLRDAMSELKLQDTALVTESTSRKLGNLLGAKYVLVGSSRKGPDGKFYVNTRLVVAETGRDVPGVAAKCSADPENWEPSVIAMSNDLLKRMRGPVLPEDTPELLPLPVEPSGLGHVKSPPAAAESIALQENRRAGITDGSEMITIPAGEFIMGSANGEDCEKPAHKVYLDAYEIGKYEVTVAQYRKFTVATGRTMPEAPFWRWIDDYPMVNVTWDEADAYCKWAGGKLPTEAEWEKAARGTDGRQYPWGKSWDKSKCGAGVALSPDSIGSYPSGVSPYGCMDMAGSVREWCKDWYSDVYYAKTPSEGWNNPQGPSSGNCRVLRGGSWYSSYYETYDFRARCAYRSSGNTIRHLINIGFRLAR